MWLKRVVGVPLFMSVGIGIAGIAGVVGVGGGGGSSLVGVFLVSWFGSMWSMASPLVGFRGMDGGRLASGVGLVDGEGLGVEMGEGLDVDLVSMSVKDWGKKWPSGAGGLLVYNFWTEVVGLMVCCGPVMLWG